MGTRTHTVYWSEESLEDLKQAHQDLVEETQERMPFISEARVREELHRRLNMLHDVIGLMGERAD